MALIIRAIIFQLSEKCPGQNSNQGPFCLSCQCSAVRAILDEPGRYNLPNLNQKVPGLNPSLNIFSPRWKNVTYDLFTNYNNGVKINQMVFFIKNFT